MNCPACERSLRKRSVGDINVDVCQGGCGGVWFDAFEFKKVDEAHEAAGEDLLDIERDESIVVDHSKRRNCPKCDGVVLRRYFFSAQRSIEIDECPQCAGFWLDNGELGAIRSKHGTEEERGQAAQAYFAELFDDELKARADERGEEVARARNVARMFRFVCPSNYIPGKQAWGAF